MPAIGRLYLPREALRPAGIDSDRSADGAGEPALGPACAFVADARARTFRAGRRIMARSPRRMVRAPRIMAEAYRRMLDDMVARGWSAPRRRVRVSQLAPHLDRVAPCVRLTRGTVHIIGAGLAGLAAAVRLAGRRRAGRACMRRPRRRAGAAAPITTSGTGMLIDNGTHLVLSGNHAVLSYLRSDRRRDSA